MGEISRLYVSVGAKIDGFVAGMGKVSKNLTGLNAKMSMLGGALTKYVTIPLAAIGAASVVAFANFEDALTKSFAIMGDLSDEMKTKMSDAAREVGKTTLFSATEAAQAFYYLASAGMDAATAIEALPRVAAFAQAGQFDLSRATELLADAQSALGLKVDDTTKNMENMARVSDVLIKANTLANATTEQFSEALTNKAAAALRIVNKEVEEGVAVLAVYADQGIKGEEAGQRMYIALRDLQRAALVNKSAFEKYNVTVFDAAGNMRHTADIVADLENAMAGMSDETKKATLMELGFQERSVAALLSLIGFSDEIRNYESALKDAAGTTDDVSQKQLESFKAKLELLKSKFIDLGIGIGEKLVPVLEGMIPAFEKLGGAIAGVLGWFSKLPPGAQAASIGILLLAGPIMKIISLANPFTAAIAVVVAGVAAIGWAANEYIQAQKEAEAAERKTVETLIKHGGSLRDLGRAMLDMGIPIERFEGDLENLNQVANEVFGEVVAAGQNMGAELGPIPEEIITAWNSQAGYFKDAAKLGMRNYITELKVQAGYSREEAEKAAKQVVDALGSEDEGAREAGERMMQELLMSLVAQGDLTITEARAIAGQIAGALEVKPQVGESMSQWARDMINLFGGVQVAANSAANAINTTTNLAGTHTEGVGGTHVAMQHGGLVTRPTLALVGEAGPELVVPLTGPNAGRGMASVSFYGDIYLPNIREPREFEAWATKQAQESKMLGAIYG